MFQLRVYRWSSYLHFLVPLPSFIWRFLGVEPATPSSPWAGRGAVSVSAVTGQARRPALVVRQYPLFCCPVVNTNTGRNGECLHPIYKPCCRLVRMDMRENKGWAKKIGKKGRTRRESIFRHDSIFNPNAVGEEGWQAFFAEWFILR